jgi:superfamily II DNA or RNA helicase
VAAICVETRLPSTIVLMRVSESIGRTISHTSRVQGTSCFQSGAVRSLSIENGVIQALVRGTASYTVWVETGDEVIRASCSCPYFVDHVDICKHIFAVVLAAEAQSIPLVAPGVRPEDVEIEALLPEDDEDFPDKDAEEEEEEEEEEEGWRLVPPRTQRATPVLPVRTPAWKQLLTTVSDDVQMPPPGRPSLLPGQLLFVIDAAASVSSNALVLELMTRDRKSNGEWGKPKIARVTVADVQQLADPDERAILDRLVGPRPHSGWFGGWGTYGLELTRLELTGALALDIVPRLCATGRCMLRRIAAGVPPRPDTTSTFTRSGPETIEVTTTTKKAIASGPATGGRSEAPATVGITRSPQPPPLETIAWDEGAPWIFTIGIRVADNDSSYIVEGWLARGDQRMTLTDPTLILADGILCTHTHAARVNAGRSFAWLAALHRTGHIVVPPEGRDELIEALLATSPQVADMPEDLRVETADVEPRPYLVLRPIPSRPDRLRAELAFDYQGTIVAVESPHRIVRSKDATRAIRRAPESERRALDLLYQRGCRDDWIHESPTRVLQLPTNQLPRLVRQVLDAGWRVEAAGRVYRQPGPTALSLRSGIDWFELHGHVEYEDQRAALPALLAALNRGETFVTLDDGTVGLLPEVWLRRQGLLARLGTVSGDHVRFKMSQAALLDAMIAAQPQISWDETFARARADLAAFDGIQPIDPPATFTGTLRAYQREGLGWLLFLQRFGFGGCLADDMGLGKTVMVLALLDVRRDTAPADGRRPSLVVAPRSLVFNWRQEAARFTPQLRVLDYTGGDRASMRSRFAEHDLVLTTYGTLRRDAEALSAERFDYVVLDEAQAIKNATSQSAKTARVLNAAHRLALSGTPIENHLGELWSLFEFLNPGLLGTARAFQRAGTAERLDDETVALLSRGLRPFILRRTKAQVASDLPSRNEQTLYCELERPQRAVYDELRAHYRRSLLEATNGNGFGRAKLQVLEALLRLRQAACHPGLIDRRHANDASAKLDVLVPRVTESVEEGHKTLVFSQFTSFLALLRTRLDAAGITYEYLDGRTQNRQSKVERFQTDPACRLFLISLKAGGLGLNLTAAEYVFLLDPWWNPAVEAQAIDRAHRIGQSRHVFAYRLIARDTVEERVLELQQRKRHLADAILTADNSLIRDLKREDLELLLS